MLLSSSRNDQSIFVLFSIFDSRLFVCACVCFFPFCCCCCCVQFNLSDIHCYLRININIIESNVKYTLNKIRKEKRTNRHVSYIYKIISKFSESQNYWKKNLNTNCHLKMFSLSMNSRKKKWTLFFLNYFTSFFVVVVSSLLTEFFLPRFFFPKDVYIHYHF